MMPAGQKSRQSWSGAFVLEAHASSQHHLEKSSCSGVCNRKAQSRERPYPQRFALALPTECVSGSRTFGYRMNGLLHAKELEDSRGARCKQLGSLGASRHSTAPEHSRISYRPYTAILSIRRTNADRRRAIGSFLPHYGGFDQTADRHGCATSGSDQHTIRELPQSFRIHQSSILACLALPVSVGYNAQRKVPLHTKHENSLLQCKFDQNSFSSPRPRYMSINGNRSNYNER